MHRLVAPALLLVVVAGCGPLGELGASTTVLNMVPDPNYQPREGDRAYLYGMRDGSPMESVPILSDLTAYDRYERALAADEPLELAELEQKGYLQSAAPGSPIFLARILDRKHTGARYAAEVKFTDGPMKGKSVWTRLDNVARLKKPDPPQ